MVAVVVVMSAAARVTMLVALVVAMVIRVGDLGLLGLARLRRLVGHGDVSLSVEFRSLPRFWVGETAQILCSSAANVLAGRCRLS